MLELTSLQFAKHFKNIVEKTGEERFCFILGSGASIQSGIPTGAQLAKKWLSELQESFWTPAHQNWLETAEINLDRPGDQYAEIFKKRFEVHPQEGYDELNRLMEKVTPSFGYSVVSQLLETKNNVVITTNFDTLIEEALYSFSIKRPLVCGHEYLAPFAKISDSRPLIIKIHRDRQLNPLNSPEQLEKIKNEWVSVLNNVFAQCIPVFIGYGGNDGSLMGYLNSIPNFPNLFWCDLNKDYLKSDVIKLIEKHKGKFVKIDGFDELMFDVFSVLGYLPLDKVVVATANKRADDYGNAIKKIQEAKSKSAINEDKTNAEELTKKIKDSGSWLSYYYKAEDENNIKLKRQILEQGLNRFPEAGGMNNAYAEYLHNYTKEYENAEKYYKKSLFLDPSDEVSNCNYALFLDDCKRDYINAEKYYLKALELAPREAANHALYAFFLYSRKQDYIGAERYFLKALDLNPYVPEVNATYAIFLDDFKKDYDEAETHYLHAIDLARKEADYYGNYAAFLKTVRKDYIKAQRYFQIALKFNPAIPECNANYAGMLLGLGRNNEATPFLETALENGDKETQLDIFFYLIAHYSDRRHEAEANLRNLLKEGYRSTQWDFAHNIERAKLDNHPDIPTLQLYADIITKDIPLPPDF